MDEDEDQVLFVERIAALDLGKAELEAGSSVVPEASPLPVTSVADDPG